MPDRGTVRITPDSGTGWPSRDDHSAAYRTLTSESTEVPTSHRTIIGVAGIVWVDASDIAVDVPHVDDGVVFGRSMMSPVPHWEDISRASRAFATHDTACSRDDDDMVIVSVIVTAHLFHTICRYL